MAQIVIFLRSKFPKFRFRYNTGSAITEHDGTLAQKGKSALRSIVSAVAPDSGIDGHAIGIQQLNQDFTNVLQEGEPGYHKPIDVTEAGNEAPVIFRRHDGTRDFYYLIYGTLCCFCAQGGDAQVKVAVDPMGPWSRSVTNLNPWTDADGNANPDHIRGQNSAVIQVHRGGGHGDVGDEFINMVDKWQQSLFGRKSDEIKEFNRLRFETRTVQIGDETYHVPVPQMKHEDFLTIDTGWRKI